MRRTNRHENSTPGSELRLACAYRYPESWVYRYFEEACRYPEIYMATRSMAMSPRPLGLWCLQKGSVNPPLQRTRLKSNKNPSQSLLTQPRHHHHLRAPSQKRIHGWRTFDAKDDDDDDEEGDSTRISCLLIMAYLACLVWNE